ncbi:U4/U6.U5 small nuclear ribonucleoprotein 27 kDa protein-like, partial [Trifolium medium]|nr:U4/U6.U5 small nuclear ribonucleoprotein 27 kDa protein-like [Trifolium medium]
RRRHHRTPSPDPPRKRHRRDSVDDDHKETKKVVSDFVDGIAKEQQEKQNENGEEVETTAVRRLS